MTEYGKYIYGIIPCEEENRAKLKVQNCSFIFYKDIAVAVTDSEITDYTLLPKNKAAKMLVSHQQTIEKIMELGYLIIPMRLGTFVTNEEEIKKFVSNGYSFIKETAKKNEGKIEVDIIALWNDFPTILKEIGEEKVIRSLKDSLMANPNKITKEDQEQIGRMIAASLDKKKNYYLNKVHESFSNIVIQYTSHEVMNDEMILNTAFLLEKKNLKAFENTLELINDEFQNKLYFRLIGPLPCYSFYTFELIRFDITKIIWAKNILNLKDVADLKEIKKNYKTEAKKLHPDKNISPTNTSFDALGTAYKTLTTYFKTNAKGAYCSFKKEDINNNLAIKLKENSYE